MSEKADPNAVEVAMLELGRGLAWAVYWIERLAEVPLPLEEEDEWERYEDAKRALRLHGPDSKTGTALRLHRMGLKGEESA